MKKIYESPESLAVFVGLHGRLLQEAISTIGGGGQPLTNEYNSSIWDDGDEKDGKKIFDEEW